RAASATKLLAAKRQVPASAKERVPSSDDQNGPLTATSRNATTSSSKASLSSVGRGRRTFRHTAGATRVELPPLMSSPSLSAAHAAAYRPVPPRPSRSPPPTGCG